jgi:ankyrin repeat protein
MTPLHWAVERGHVSCVEALLRFGADVDLESKFDKTPMEIASDNGRADIFEVLQVK